MDHRLNLSNFQFGSVADAIELLGVGGLSIRYADGTTMPVEDAIKYMVLYPNMSAVEIMEEFCRENNCSLVAP